MEGLAARLDDVRSIELDNAFYVEDGTWIESLTVSAGSEFDSTALINDMSGVSLTYSYEIPSGPTDVTVRRLTILANESYPFILGLVLRNEAIPNLIVLQRDTFKVVVTVQEWDQFRNLADKIQDTLGEFDLVSVNQIDEPGEPLDSGRLSEVLVTKLPEEQLAILETAYDMGYFDVPRKAAANEVAEEFDIAQSTMSERLRTAERNLLEIIYGPRES